MTTGFSPLVLEIQGDLTSSHCDTNRPGNVNFGLATAVSVNILYHAALLSEKSVEFVNAKSLIISL